MVRRCISKMMRIHCTRYLVQNLKSSSFQNAVKHCLGNSETALFSTSISLQRKDSSGLRSNPKIDELFPNVVDFPNRHIGPRKHETKAMCDELGYNVSSNKANFVTAVKFFVACVRCILCIFLMIFRIL